jgi:hypothetical protein
VINEAIGYEGQFKTVCYSSNSKKDSVKEVRMQAFGSDKPKSGNNSGKKTITINLKEGRR